MDPKKLRTDGRRIITICKKNKDGKWYGMLMYIGTHAGLPALLPTGNLITILDPKKWKLYKLSNKVLLYTELIKD